MNKKVISPEFQRKLDSLLPNKSIEVIIRASTEPSGSFNLLKSYMCNNRIPCRVLDLVRGVSVTLTSNQIYDLSKQKYVSLIEGDMNAEAVR